MKLEIREPKGIRYTESVGDLSILGKKYEILFGHAWQKTKWRLKDIEKKTIEYSISEGRMLDASEKTICEIKENSECQITLSIRGSKLELKRSSIKGILIEEEEWMAYLDENEIGSLTVRSPILVHISLDAEFTDPHEQFILLAAFCLWTNCHNRYHE